ncbi:hypothetical protein [Planctopirus hydrillae]|uniref:Uncharacterized protein n=1 Tax=Planctopirus hydrillae TaxID=1841610 RepID=A0A1C3ENE6_9PLAN|nr:hypothetical protein [Planctopirus hydrillae]ODA34760.1 hypothetical protein A6X21_03610 [Planctopirus hydrillae]
MKNLWLPPRLTGESSFQQLSHYIGIEELNGVKPAVPDLISQLSVLPQSKALAWLCWLSSYISQPENKDIQAQINLCKEFLPPHFQDAYRRHIESETHELGSPGRLFHIQQIWLMVQMTVICCKDETVEIPHMEFVHKIAVASLMANTILIQIDDVVRPEPLEENNFEQWCIANFLPLHGVNTEIDTLYRSHTIWFESAKSKQVIENASQLGIEPQLENAFSTAHGISLKEFFTLLVAIRIFFESQILKDPTSPHLWDATSHFGEAFNADFIKIAMPLISQTPKELSIRLMGNRQSWATDLSPLRDYPLLQISDGKYCCPDLSLLRNAVADRTSKLLADAYPPQKFRSLYGRIFEDYLQRIVDDFAPRSETLVSHSFFGPKFNGGNDEAGDCILHYDDVAIVMEWKSNRLSAHQKYGASATDLAQGIRDILAKSTEKNGKENQRKGVRQLCTVIKRMLSGELVRAENQQPTDLSRCSMYFPVVVVAEEALAMNCSRDLIQERFNEFLRTAQCDTTRIGPVMIFSITDFEILQAVACRKPVRRLFEGFGAYLKDHGTGNPSGGFSEYVYNTSCDTSLLPIRNRSIYQIYADELISRLDSNNNKQ